jgi:hypothetical protein
MILLIDYLPVTYSPLFEDSAQKTKLIAHEFKPAGYSP